MAPAVAVAVTVAGVDVIAAVIVGGVVVVVVVIIIVVTVMSITALLLLLLWLLLLLLLLLLRLQQSKDRFDVRGIVGRYVSQVGGLVVGMVREHLLVDLRERGYMVRGVL